MRLPSTQREIEQLQTQLEQAPSEIAAMKTIKFWKLRTQWFQLKKWLGFNIKSPYHHSSKCALCAATGNKIIKNKLIRKMLKELLEKSPGFATEIALQEHEIKRVRELIENQWLGRIKQVIPEQTELFAQQGIAQYHQLCHLLDHSSVWGREVRMLPPSAVTEIRQMSLFQALESEWGLLGISDEEYPGKEIMHWRLVRPNQPSDIGPIHADKWFWDLNNWPVPANTHRVKVWIAIYTEPGLSGLRVVPDSQQKTWQYQPAKRHGVLKPLFDCKENQISPQLVNTRSGEAIIFHDQLLHGGAINRGTLTRVSLEFTLFVSN